MTHALTIEELGPDRVGILDDVIRTLERFADQLPACGTTASGRDEALMAIVHPPVEQREPRVITFDGERGAGKTSLMLTLVDAWHRARTGEGSEGYWQPRGSLLSQCLPLPSVDFDPHPQDMPVYAQVIAAFHPIVSTLDRQPCPDPLQSTPSTPLTERWNLLMQRALVGWNIGSAGIQHKSMDSWAFSAQQHVASWRLLERDFRDFLDLVSAALQRRGFLGPRGLILLHVDDADMRITGVRELLLVLRRLHHPRLVFLVSLDITLATEAIDQELRRAAGPQQPRNDKSPLNDLAKQIVEKSLPARQRYRVERVPLDRIPSVVFVEAGKAVTLNGTLEALGLLDSALWSPSGGLVLRLDDYLPATKSVSLRTAREGILHVKNLLNGEELSTNSERALALVWVLQWLSSHFSSEEAAWTVVRGQASGEPDQLAGALSVESSPPPHLFITDRPAGVYIGDTELWAGKTLADPFMLLARQVADTEWVRAQADSTDNDSAAPSVVYDAPDDYIVYSWDVYTLEHQLPVPWPLGPTPNLTGWGSRERPTRGLITKDRHTELVLNWLDTNLPGARFDSGPPAIDSPDVIARLERAVFALEDHLTYPALEVAKMLGLLASPECGLQEDLRIHLVELIDLLAQRVHRDEGEKWKNLWRWTLEIGTARVFRQKHVERSADRLGEKVLRNILTSLTSISDPLQLLKERAERPGDWWFNRDRFGMDHLFNASDRSGSSIRIHLGIETKLGGLPDHFVTRAFGEVLWNAKRHRRFYDRQSRLQNTANGMAASFVVDIWRQWSAELPAEMVNAVEIDPADSMRVRSSLPTPFLELGPPDQQPVIEGTTVNARGTWLCDDISGPPQTVRALTALRMVAEWLIDSPENQVPSQPLMQLADGQLRWPAFPLPTQTERFRVIALWAAERAQRTQGSDRASMQRWLLCQLALTASLVASDETYLFPSGQPAVAIPADDNAVTETSRELMNWLTNRERPTREWAAHALLTIPRFLNVKAREAWKAGIRRVTNGVLLARLKEVGDGPLVADLASAIVLLAEEPTDRRLPNATRNTKSMLPLDVQNLPSVSYLEELVSHGYPEEELQEWLATLWNAAKLEGSP